MKQVGCTMLRKKDTERRHIVCISFRHLNDMLFPFLVGERYDDKNTCNYFFVRILMKRSKHIIITRSAANHIFQMYAKKDYTIWSHPINIFR